MPRMFRAPRKRFWKICGNFAEYSKKSLHFPAEYAKMVKLSLMAVSRSSRRVTIAQIPGEVITMGKFCQVCEKGQMIGHNVSHSNRKSSRAWAPNVQRVRVMLDGKPVHLNVCTRCLRSGYVQRALPTQSEAVTEEA